MIFRFFLILLFLFSFLNAKTDENITMEDNLSVLIERLKNADIKERYIYMNKIKLILREMNAQKREKIVRELRKSFAKRKEKNILYNKQNKIDNFEYREIGRERRREGHGRR